MVGGGYETVVAYYFVVVAGFWIHCQSPDSITSIELFPFCSVSSCFGWGTVRDGIPAVNTSKTIHVSSKLTWMTTTILPRGIFVDFDREISEKPGILAIVVRRKCFMGFPCNTIANVVSVY